MPDFFLNVGYSNRDPWVDLDVAAVARKHFMLQNRITWVKSISIDEETYGHFKPVNSPRFLNQTNEFVFHFTETGAVRVDRRTIGVPYKWKSNLDQRSRVRGRLAKKFGFKNWRDFDARATEIDRSRLRAELGGRVWRLDRLGRSLKHLVTLLDELQGSGWGLCPSGKASTCRRQRVGCSCIFSPPWRSSSGSASPSGYGLGWHVRGPTDNVWDRNPSTSPRHTLTGPRTSASDAQPPSWASRGRCYTGRGCPADLLESGSRRANETGSLSVPVSVSREDLFEGQI